MKEYTDTKLCLLAMLKILTESERALTRREIEDRLINRYEIEVGRKTFASNIRAISCLYPVDVTREGSMTYYRLE